MENDRRKRGNNLMTQFTFTSLQEELRQATAAKDQSLRDIGAAAGSESDWHDNAAFDHANMKHDLDSSLLANLQKKLKDVEIIGPSYDTRKVNVGNTVVIKFESEPEEETFTILGPDDSGRKPGWISYESPVGSHLIGKKQGDTITLSTREPQQKIRIISILPGDFS